MTRAQLAAALLASEYASPVRNDLGYARKPLRQIANAPTPKRAKVKAARKQRNRKCPKT